MRNPLRLAEMVEAFLSNVGATDCSLLHICFVPSSVFMSTAENNT